MDPRRTSSPTHLGAESATESRSTQSSPAGAVTESAGVGYRSAAWNSPRTWHMTPKWCPAARARCWQEDEDDCHLVGRAAVKSQLARGGAGGWAAR
jgi:hypothetical protein